MWFDIPDFEFKRHWAVTFNLYYFVIREANLAACSHVNLRRKQVVLFGVNHWKSMNGNQYLVSFTMDSDAVIEILEFVVRSELDVDVLADTRWDHTLLVVLDLEEGGARWQDVQSLRSWTIVDQLYLQSVCLAQLVASELHNAWRSAENAVAADSVELVELAEVVDLISFCFSQHLSLELDGLLHDQGFVLVLEQVLDTLGD